MGKPFSAMLRARFCPMTARPARPILVSAISYTEKNAADTSGIAKFSLWRSHSTRKAKNIACMLNLQRPNEINSA
jgi:hypothetical protein